MNRGKPKGDILIYYFERTLNGMKALKDHPIASFVIKTILYFIILMLLIYMYGYFGIGQAPFIYNEF